MEVTNCTDINGVALNEVQFNMDGTVVGILEINDTSTTSNLSFACCEAQGWSFDPTDTKCYWAASCLNGGNYNIVLDPVGNTGALFQIDENQEGICSLELEFDWLLKFDCSKLKISLRQLLEELKLTVRIEKVIFDESLPIPNNLELVESKPMFDITNIFTYLDGNENTGLLLTGPDNNCDPIYQNFLNDLQPNDAVVNDFSLNSDWVKFRMVIEDLDILESIYNERLKISIQGNSLANFSILIDDIKLNRICDVPTPPRFLDKECPKFELKRVIDNKKSWVEKSEFEVREFDLERRKTNYAINEEKLSINTKEVEIGINPSKALETDIFNSIIGNPCLLTPATGCTSGDTTHPCVDLRPLITVPLIEIVDNDELLNMLIDAKSRKTIGAYPIIELLYYRYRNSQEHCGLNLNNIDEDSLDQFIDLIGTYWSDLIEQLVPATTIWGSSITSGGNAFTGRSSNKFKYKKYTSFACGTAPSYPLPSPTELDVNVGVIAEDITSGVISTLSQSCNVLSIRQINDGSEFIGTVTIIGGNEGPTSGSTISITESITDECNLFEVCYPLSRDFNGNDFNPNDFI
tara:strand:+ start:373 stop:2106 length:1734 start_codon:yes stop_codon:yes gene_type:complete